MKAAFSTFSIEVASVPDRDELVAELWYGQQQVAELSQENGSLKLQVYRPPSGKWWEFDYPEFVSQLTQMEERLRG